MILEENSGQINYGFSAKDRSDDFSVKSKPTQFVAVTLRENDSKPPRNQPNTSYRPSWQVLATFGGAMVHLGMGVMTGLSGIILPSLMDPLSDDIILTKGQASMFSSIISVGAILGSLISGPLLVAFGHPRNLLVLLPISMASWFALAFGQSFWVLLAARLIGGFLIGLGTPCATNFVLEISHASTKGRAVAILDLFRQLGYLFVFVIGSTNLSWRTVSLACGLSSLVIPFCIFLFVTDSPRWLATKGRMDDVKASLSFFRGAEFDVMPEYKSISLMAEAGAPRSSVISQLNVLKERHISRIFIICAYMAFAGHFTGNLVIVGYGATIFQSTGSSLSPYLSTIIIGIVRCIGTVVYACCADHFAKRKLLIGPLLVAAISMIVFGVYFQFSESKYDMDQYSWLPLTSAIIFSFFTCMFNPVLTILRSELIPNSFRSLGGGFLSVFFSAGAFAVIQSFPYMVDSMGSSGTFIFYAANTIALTVVVALFVPETQGKSLEEIEQIIKMTAKK